MFKTFSPGMQVLLFLFIAIFCGMLGQSILGIVLRLAIDQESLTQLSLSEPKVFYTLNLFSQVFTFLVAFLAYLRLTGEQFNDLVTINRIQLKPLLITCGILIVSLFAFPLFEYLNEPLSRILPYSIVEAELLRDQQYTELLVQSDPIQFVFSLIILALLPAIFEELVFRGFLLKKMMQSGMSEYGAVIMSAVVFSVIHMQPMKILVMFTLGALLGLIYVKFRNIKYAIILHFLFNGVQITMAFLEGSGLPYLDF